MIAIKDRIKQVRQDAGLTQAEFAKKLNLSRNYVGLMEIGDRVPSDRTLADICEKFRVSETWLKDGTEPMYIESQRDDDIKVIFDEIGVSGDELIKAIVKSYWQLSDSDKAAVHKLIDRFVDEMSKKKSPGAGPGQG